MNFNRKTIFYCLLGIILAASAWSQAMNKSYLAIFPLFGSVAFFVNAWRAKNK
ncbi:hypothetical protein [Paenibacillus tyrfis]|uniref:hypothetical protein n=1 Tax=Paenibacillus tyrfis TaxID=1501230 RepID=UPI0020A03E6B|nr:hypothetical protein [Paenibacillus tyrfis]MCP1312666.1 hypothetical protein [Paenibacillus tyrfis]